MSARRLSIGVMGTSGGILSDEVRERAYRLGRAIAEHGAVLITGACPGLPDEAVQGRSIFRRRARKSGARSASPGW
jgi:predicted Rossmann-fold nucleotide-binding protein